MNCKCFLPQPQHFNMEKENMFSPWPIDQNDIITNSYVCIKTIKKQIYVNLLNWECCNFLCELESEKMKWLVNIFRLRQCFLQQVEGFSNDRQLCTVLDDDGLRRWWRLPASGSVSLTGLPPFFAGDHHILLPGHPRHKRKGESETPCFQKAKHVSLFLHIDQIQFWKFTW